MKKTKLFGLGAVTSAARLSLGAYDNNDPIDSSGGKSLSDATTATLVIDTDDVDNRSFNQSAWEGLEKWERDQGSSRGNGDLQYFQSSDESDYIPNIDQALGVGFKTIFDTGYKLRPAIQEQAANNTDTNFVTIGGVIDGSGNVVSATFKDNETSYPAGVTAAYTTETNVAGFTDGVKGETIDHSDTGSKVGIDAGTKGLGKKVKALNQCAGNFSAPDIGHSIAQGIYAQNVGIIFHTSGGTGSGAFQETESLNGSDDKKAQVIGVDRDRLDEGGYTLSGEEKSFTLIPTLEVVETVVEDLAQKSADGKFPGDEHTVCGLKEDGVGLTEEQLSDEVKEAADETKEKIISGDVEIPEALEEN